MNNTELAWARLHDWCLHTGLGSTGKGYAVVKDADCQHGERTFTDWIELKTWAGY